MKQQIYTRISNMIERLTDSNYIELNSTLPKGDLYLIINNLFESYDNFEYIIYMHNDDYNLLSDYVILYNNADINDKSSDKFKHISYERIILNDKPIYIINLPLAFLKDKQDPNKLVMFMRLLVAIMIDDLKINSGITMNNLVAPYIVYYTLKLNYTFKDDKDVLEYIIDKNNDEFDSIKNIFEDAFNDPIEEVLDRMKLFYYIKKYKTNK